MHNSAAPAPPDPNVVSAAQTQSNKDTAGYNASLNHGNTSTPFGSSTYSQRTDPQTGAPIYDQTIALSPDQQSLLDQQNKQDLQLGQLSGALATQAGNNYATPMDTSGMPKIQGAPAQQDYQRNLDLSNLPALQGTDDAARKQISDALYNKQTAYLDPQYQQREDQLRTRLATQGITQNSEAWNNALDEQNRSRSFDYDQARNSAITGSGNEISQLAATALANRGEMYNEKSGAGNFANSATGATNADSLRAAGFNNDASQQALAQAMAKRNEPLNELNAVRSATQVNAPQFSGPPSTSIASTDTQGNMWNNYNSLLNIWNAQNQSNNGMMGGLMGLGGTLGGAAIKQRG